MQGVETVEGLGERIAAFLGNYVERARRRRWLLRREARRTCGASGRTRAARGRVGRVGRGARGRPHGAGLWRQRVHRDRRRLPADFFPVTSGLGQSRARRLVAAPTTADGAPNGSRRAGLAFIAFVPRRRSSSSNASRRPSGSRCGPARDRKVLQETLEETCSGRPRSCRHSRRSSASRTRSSNSKAGRCRSRRFGSRISRLSSSEINSKPRGARRRRSSSSATTCCARRRTSTARAPTSPEFLANMSHGAAHALQQHAFLSSRSCSPTTARRQPHGRADQVRRDDLRRGQRSADAHQRHPRMVEDRGGQAGACVPEEIAVARLCDELVERVRPRGARQAGASSFGDGRRRRAGRHRHRRGARAAGAAESIVERPQAFTERGGVSLHVRREGARVAFAVKDTGIGVAPEQHEIIFEVFRQADGTTNWKYGGTRPRSSIPRDLARLLGGELTLEQRARTRQHVHPHPAAEARRRGGSRGSPGRRASSAWTHDPSARRVAGAEARRRPGAGRTILIVEDDPKFAEVLQGARARAGLSAHPRDLGRRGCSSLSRADAPERHRARRGPARSLGPLPCSGDALKHKSVTRHIPVHMVSVSDYTQTALEMGATGYAIKPVRRDEIVTALKRLRDQVHAAPAPRARRRGRSRRARQHVSPADGGGCPDRRRGQRPPPRPCGARRVPRPSICMVLDLSLPDRSGFELLEEMSKTDRYWRSRP